MAKDTNLEEFLTDIADAIREITGEADLINAQDFSTKIREMEIGGSYDPTKSDMNNDFNNDF